MRLTLVALTFLFSCLCSINFHIFVARKTQPLALPLRRPRDMCHYHTRDYRMTLAMPISTWEIRLDFEFRLHCAAYDSAYVVCMPGKCDWEKLRNALSQMWQQHAAKLQLQMQPQLLLRWYIAGRCHKEEKCVWRYTSVCVECVRWVWGVFEECAYIFFFAEENVKGENVKKILFFFLACKCNMCVKSV